MTGAVFAQAGYHKIADPLGRIVGYLDFRALIAEGPLEAFTCFAGTTIQDVFAASEPIRLAASESLLGHADTLADNFRAAVERLRPRATFGAENLAIYTQAAMQGGFVLSKAKGNAGPLREAITHLTRYLRLLFNQERHDE